MQNKNLSLSNLLIVSIAAFFYLYMFYVRVLPSIMLQPLMRSFDIGGFQVGMLMFSFVYAYALSQIPSGLLIDHYGPRKILFFGMLGCFISSYLFQATHNFWIAVLARFILGLCCGPAFIAPMSLVKSRLPEHLFTPAAGFIQLLGCLGAMLTTPLCTYSARFGWEEVILSSAIIALLLAILYFFLPKDRPLTKKETLSVSDALKTIASERSYWIIGFFAFASWAGIGGFTESWGVSYLSLVQGISSQAASFQMNFTWLGVALASPLAGFWFEHQPTKLPLIVLYSAGFISILLLLMDITNPYLICTLLFVLGLSAGAQPIAFKLISKNSAINIHATAVSFCNMCVIAGAFALQPLISKILELSWDGNIIEGIPAYSIYNFQLSFLPIVVVFLTAILLTIFSTEIDHELS